MGLDRIKWAKQCGKIWIDIYQLLEQFCEQISVS